MNAVAGCVLQASGCDATETKLHCWLQLEKGRKGKELNGIKRQPTLLLQHWPLSQTSPPQAGDHSVSSSLSCLLHCGFTCRALFVSTSPAYFQQHMPYISSVQSPSAMYEKVLACWQWPQTGSELSIKT